MNTHVLVPLIATIAYIPLLIILLANRPWDRKQRFAFLFLIPAILWSLTDTFFRSDFFMPDKLFLVKVVLCFAVWMGVQGHYSLRSFHSSQRLKIPFAYILLVSCIVLAALGYIPRGIDVTTGSIAVDYGNWFILVVFVLFTLIAKDVHLLSRKLKVLADPLERNQIFYLLPGVAILVGFTLSSFAPEGGKYPISHIGNLITAGILIYAVLAHHLLDVRVTLRRGLIWLSVCIVGAWAYVG